MAARQIAAMKPGGDKPRALQNPTMSSDYALGPFAQEEKPGQGKDRPAAQQKTHHHTDVF